MKAFLVARQLVAKRNYEFHSSQAIHVIPLHESGVEKGEKSRKFDGKRDTRKEGGNSERNPADRQLFLSREGENNRDWDNGDGAEIRNDVFRTS